MACACTEVRGRGAMCAGRGWRGGERCEQLRNMRGMSGCEVAQHVRWRLWIALLIS